MGFGSGQMLLVALGIVLLGKIILSANSVIANGEIDSWENEAITTATGVGQAMMDRITVKGYDQNFYGGLDTNATAFVYALGRDGALEIAGRDTTFNDIDDYKGFVDSTVTPRFGTFHVSCNVCYVNEYPPFDSTTVRTFFKRVTVTVTNSFLIDPADPRKLAVPMTFSRLVGYR